MTFSTSELMTRGHLFHSDHNMMDNDELATRELVSQSDFIQ